VRESDTLLVLQNERVIGRAVVRRSPVMNELRSASGS
jgi:hypothetical protein